MTTPESAADVGMSQTELMLRRIAALLPSMIAYWDSSERCLFANHAYLQWFGVHPDAVIGRTMKELLGPIYPRNKPHIDAALRGEPQRFEREIPDPAGGPPRQSLATYTPDIEDGRVRGFVVLVNDISDHKQMQEELRRAKESAEASLAQVKTLTGLLPICAWCGKIRDDAGYWSSIEQYLSVHTDARVSHGICRTCSETHFPELSG